MLRAAIWAVLLAIVVIGAGICPLVSCVAHSQMPSPTIRRACDSDVRRLCPIERALKDSTAIGECMRKHAADISLKCVAAWILEHPEAK